MTDPDISKALVDPELPLTEALRRIDEFGHKIVFVTDDERRLVGVVTDGDIRRWILAGNGLGRPVAEVMPRDPVVLELGFEPGDARALLARHGIDTIPVLDAERRVQSVVWWVDYLEGRARRPASLGLPIVVMAGG